MFLHLSVILFTGGVSFQGVCLRGGSLSRGDLCPGGLCVGGSLSRGVSVRETPVRLCAGVTHPTGMHSCILCTYQILKGRQWVLMQWGIYSIPKHRQKTLESACSPVEHKTEINVRPSIIFNPRCWSCFKCVLFKLLYNAVGRKMQLVIEFGDGVLQRQFDSKI